MLKYCLRPQAGLWAILILVSERTRTPIQGWTWDCRVGSQAEVIAVSTRACEKKPSPGRLQQCWLLPHRQSGYTTGACYLTGLAKLLADLRWVSGVQSQRGGKITAMGATGHGRSRARPQSVPNGGPMRYQVVMPRKGWASLVDRQSDNRKRPVSKMGKTAA